MTSLASNQLEALVAALGTECINQLCAATPTPPMDTGLVRDRFVLNPGALAYWLWTHFNINVFDPGDAEIEADPASEVISIVGQGQYAIPHWCYLSTGLESGDQRPASWPGI